MEHGRKTHIRHLFNCQLKDKYPESQDELAYTVKSKIISSVSNLTCKVYIYYSCLCPMWADRVCSSQLLRELGY